MGRRRTNPSEAQEQVAAIQWISLKHPELIPFVIKIHNEGARSPYQAMWLKRLGLRPGASDIFLSYPTERHHGFFVEMKQNRKYSDSEMSTNTWKNQRQFIALMKSVGFEAKFCFGWEECAKAIEEYLSPHVF